MQSVYSFLGSPLHLILEDDVALRYNLVAFEFFAAQKRHMEETGTFWDPSTPLRIANVTDKDMEAWNNVGRIIDLLCEINGGLDISEEQITSDYLVKI